MADDIDRAQEREQLDRDMAIRAASERIAASFTPRDPRVADFCIECNEAIEPERLAALDRKTSRCSDCAHAFEKMFKSAGKKWGR